MARRDGGSIWICNGVQGGLRGRGCSWLWLHASERTFTCTQRERVSVSTFELQRRAAGVKGMLAVVVVCVQWLKKYFDPLLKGG